MPQTAQVFRLRVNTSNQIHQALTNLTGKTQEVYPRIENLSLDPTTNRVIGSIHIRILEGGFTVYPVFYFVCDVNTTYCYMIGSSGGRYNAIEVMNKEIDPDNPVITPIELTNDNVLEDIFGLLKSANNRNYIKKMKLKFGSNGLFFGDNNSPLYELEYRFVGNICASTHTEYQRFITGAIHVNANFGIWSLSTINRPLKATTLTVNKDFSFRLWFDYPYGDWINILDILTRF